ncbi:MAG: ABC transporter permease [Anaerolineales bacterium]|nr:ABC transporter permease [Anaerolineales bacterium]MCA9929960.1 ABC transporter permease [Anaerolineales bacterium]
MATVAQIPDDNIANIHDYKSNSLWRLTLRRIFRQRSAIVGMSILLIISLLAIFAPVLAPYDPTDVLIGKEEGIKKRQPPCIHLLGCDESLPQHFLGIDGNVRDVYSRMLYGARVSLQIGFVVVTVAAVSGTILGALAGYAGGWTDNLIMRIMDIFLAFPFLLLAISIVFVLGPGLTNAMLAISIVSMPAYARVVRAAVLSIRETDYVEASRALGAGGFDILIKRILPNAVPPLIVLATLGVATAILDTAALSFLGLGAQPPLSEWGTMLGSERNQLFSAPHLVFVPGIAISITVLAFNLLGDGLRDALDPRLVNVGRDK